MCVTFSFYCEFTLHSSSDKNSGSKVSMGRKIHEKGRDRRKVITTFLKL